MKKLSRPFSRARAWLIGLAGVTCAVALGLALEPGCIFAFTQNSLGQGSGSVSGTIEAADCWYGSYNLGASNQLFFSGVPYMNTFDIRVQRGSDYETFSDGLAILIDNVETIRPDNGPDSGLYGQPLAVSLAAGVSPPGVPLQANPDPAGVHISLYLQSSCQIQDVALYALGEVTKPAGTEDGGPGDTCLVDGGIVQVQCGAGTAADGSVPDGGPEAGGGAVGTTIGRSTITFTSLFDNNPDESNAAQRLTAATFDLYLADPREVCPGGIGPPPPCRGHLTGSFRFYFQSGQPGQPFP